MSWGFFFYQQIHKDDVSLDIKGSAYRSRLRHGKHINHSHCVVVHEFSQHQSHDFHWYTSTAVLQHLMGSKRMRSQHY